MIDIDALGLADAQRYMDAFGGTILMKQYDSQII